MPIPVKITGSWSNPHYEPDINLLKTIPGALGNVSKGLGGLPIPGTGGGSQAPASTGNVGKTLKGLFGQ